LILPARLARSLPPLGPVRLWPWPAGFRLLAGREVARQAERIAEDGRPILHALCRDAAPVAAALAAAWDSRFLLTCHRPGGDLGRWTGRHLDRLAAVLAVGTPVADAVRRRYGLGEPRVRLTRQGVPVTGTVACFSRPNHIPVLVIAARPRNRDAVFAALQAVRRTLDEGTEFHVLLLAARPAMPRGLRARIAELDLRSAVTAFDAALPLSQVLRGGDLFCQPYPQRRPSVDLLTAMACGLAPVVLAETPFGHLRHGENALLLAAADPDSIADALHAAFADRRATRRLAHNAQETVRALHRPRAEVDALIAAYAQFSQNEHHDPPSDG